MTRLIPVVLFIATIALANIVTAATEPLEVGSFLITWGTFAAALTLILRDLVQMFHGRRRTYEVIGVGLVVAAVTSAVLGDTLAVVVASAAALAVGSLFDTEVFTRLQARVPERVLASGLVGGTLDTAVFVVIGLSPLWSGIVPWSAVPNAILGVALAKAVLQLVGAVLWWAFRGHERLAPQAA